ncbi:MAG TPA: isoprenylcysteine carboxylmethyltransferase family protein [Candidatus Limnocylindrales bacterium]
MDGARLPSLGPRGEGWVVLQVVFFAGVGAAGLLGPAWGDPWRIVGLVAGVGLVALGAAAAVLGVVGLRENMTAVPRPIEGGRLIDSGVYGLVRHPIYTAIVTAGLGWGLATASPAALVATVLLGCFFDLKSRREEAWLLVAYPTYAAYRARVRRLVPFIY